MNRLVMVVVMLWFTTYTLTGKSIRYVSAPNQAHETTHQDTTRIDTSMTLRGVTVTGSKQHDFRMQSSQNRVQIDRNYLRANFAGSLMQSLEGIPGIKAMSIGSGQSKPVIRGLGFNRMVVTENGVKHEGQQWGDDHGLEIDQFSIDRIEVIKGPAALLYGSDAMGGVVNLYTNYLPTERFAGSVSVFGRSNNESVGVSAKVEGRHNHFFYKAHVTWIDYADYKVPTDSIEYYSYNIGLKNHRLRNTAGKEQNASVTLGYVGSHFRNDLKISNSYMKSGFFANAHGLEVRLSGIDYDASSRDIDLPYQWVNHLMLTNRSTWNKDKWFAEGILAYQHNKREELAEAVSHGYMPIPNGTVERSFAKSTYTAGLNLRYQLLPNNTLSAGWAAEYQHNRRNGWGFIIPDFETFTTGVYLFDKHELSRNLILNAGVRYDFARTNIHSYRDWFETPTENGKVFKERSGNIRRKFNSLTWSAGVNYSVGHWTLKANAGKSFRIPIPKELGVDGINYHIFRYEQGNANLSPEESYQLDAGISWSNNRLTVELEPYFNYFPNYIYMNPTSDYIEGLQQYYYTQSKVMRYGFECQATYRIAHYLEAQLKGEYLYAEQLSGQKKGYTLPFSPPMSMDVGMKYLFDNRTTENNGYVSLTGHLVAAQHEIVPPEKPTSGYFTLNMTAGKSFTFEGCTMDLSIHADNLLNRKYYNHTNYYRLMNIPEPGTNVAIMVGINF